MILQLTKQDSSILSLHMAIMRPNVRNGFKSNYGKKQGKELLGSFDQVKADLEKELDQVDDSEMTEEELVAEGAKLVDFHFNIAEIMMASSFLDYYVSEFESLLKKGEKIAENDQVHLNRLGAIKTKLDELKVIHQVG